MLACFTLAHRMDALPPLHCRTEFRTYIAVLQSKAVPSSEQACFCLPSYLYYFLRINYSSDFERLRIRRHRPTKYLLHSSHLYDDYGAYLAIDHHSPRVVVTSFPLNTDRPSNISDLGFCTAEQCRFLILFNQKSHPNRERRSHHSTVLGKNLDDQRERSARIHFRLPCEYCP